MKEHALENPIVYPGELVTYVKFDRRLKQQWDDNAWNDTLYIVMGVATSNVVRHKIYGNVVTIDTAIRLQQENARFMNASNREFRIDTSADDEKVTKNAIIVVDQYSKDASPVVIADDISLANGEDFQKSTIVGYDTLAKVVEELMKPRPAEALTKQGQRVASCLIYSLGLLDGAAMNETR